MVKNKKSYVVPDFSVRRIEQTDAILQASDGDEAHSDISVSDPFYYLFNDGSEIEW